MQTFLQEAAQRLYERYGSDISSLHIVLSSRRARLFFSDALAKIIDKPIWQPRYSSMDDIMTKYSSLQVGEKIRLITELYRIYAEYHPLETFDKFYFWGEVLLADFDLIDKYMIDADMLFRNLCDLKELESDLSYLSDEMRELIHSFWSNFTPEVTLSTEKDKFLKIWLSLAPIYHRFRERLTSLGIAYPGMIYRAAAEYIERDGVQEQSRYIFIGFNALSECERRVLRCLDRNDSCEFIWDSDTYYTTNKEQEAGRFLIENIREFKAKDEITCDNFTSTKKLLQSISCVSNVVQCKYVNSLLREISPSLTFDKQTAIVLTDESLLMPLLHSLPEEVSRNVNVTMGYPLRQTTAYSLIERLIELQKRCRIGGETTFYHADVMGVLSHPYISESIGSKASELCNKIIKGRYIRVNQSLLVEDERLATIFSSGHTSLAHYLLNTLQSVATMSKTNQASAEHTRKMSYLSLIANSITELDNVLKDCRIEISTTIYTSLLRRHLQTIRIPFSGEPLQGLQIMGILETRNIDFKNVIILSMNDDNFPGKIANSTSFIPYNLRAAYGIPTPEYHESVYAYYFYRLLQRAERVDMLYCSHADLKSNGERSRYIYQLEYESPYSVKHINVGVDVALEESMHTVAKTGLVAEELQRYIGHDNKPAEKSLSPSTFAQYIACPMQFYFSKIAHIKPSDTLSEDIDNSMLGTILHEAMHRLYKPLKGIVNPSHELQRILQSDDIEKAVVGAINKEYLNNPTSTQEEYTGHLLLVKNIITKYIRQGIIPFDKAHNAFTLIECEEPIYTRFTISDGRWVNIGGIADRIDSLDDGRLRVVDYKTGAGGNKKTNVKEMEDLFNNKADHRYVFQTLLYSMVLNHTLGREVVPALFFARDLNKALRDTEYSPYPTLKGDTLDYTHCSEEFEALLREKLEELFDLSHEFERCEANTNHSPCQYCDYKSICKR